ncbi:phosphotransferase [Oscillatoriales cyanobacterium LEGE 11467]|uniref:Phosphotransferase n=1 Tax=Zarconia navalis LEGE 11467 TaxID=1828826 RepID=A0A928ZAX3_9CYAN|nr:aminoglycoside phosphotransferase family protein [Zarconia navalis]MBE9042086.1 phosphotransferase [Zarconia navalis LEGE 11467]
MKTVLTKFEAVTPEQVRAGLFEPLEQVLSPQSVGEISQLCKPKSTFDDVTKLVAKDRKGKPIAVILCSPPTAPERVAQSMKKTRLAQLALSPELAHVVLTPLFEGRTYGLSYAVLPYHQPLNAGKLGWYVQRSRLRPEIFKLLLRMTQLTCTPVSHSDVETNFVQPLKYFIELDGLPNEIHALAKDSLDRLMAGKWQPRHVLMHNDLWKGNILLDRNLSRSPKDWQNQFVLIDWGGSMTRGYAMYDLVRLARTMNLKPAELRSQIDAHCRTLDCDLVGARCHLMAALSHLGMHLEHFPFSRFKMVVENSVATLTSI